MRGKDPLKYVRPNILALKPYSTARDEFKGGDIDVWVDANENPYNNGLNRYPDPHHRKLKNKISKLKNIPAEMIFIGGAGSDEAIDLTYRIFCTPGKDKVIIIQPTYGVYGVSAEINDVGIVELQLNKDFSLPIEEILNKIREDSGIKLIWICSPNNPTGNSFPREEILKIAKVFDGIVAVDEAYIDFSVRDSLLSEIKNYPNLVILQTFSKAWGMASLRCGMAFAVPEIASIYNNVKYPYNLNGPTQVKVEEMLYISPEEKVSEIIEERKKMANGLEEASCVTKVFPSDANFLLVEVTEPDKIYDYLIRNGVIVRNRSRVKGCGNSLRITVGTPEENEHILRLMKNYGEDG